MKKGLMKNLQCKVLTIVVGMLLMIPSLMAQYEQTITINESYSISQGALIKVDHQKGELRIKRTTGKKILVQMDARVQGKRENDVNEFIEAIAVSQVQEGSNIILTSNGNMSNWSIQNGKSRLTMRGGKEFRGIKEIEMDLEISIPDGVNLEISNKYDDISVEEIKANVYVKNYNGNVYTDNVDGDFFLDLKYGKAKIGNVRDAEFILYESVLNMGNASDIKLNTKYSKHVLGKVKSVEIKSYEGTFEIGKVDKDINIEDKYSDWTIGQFNDGKIEGYESEWNIGKANNISLTSKYGDFNIGSVIKVDFEKSYEDDVELGKVEELKCDNSKYMDVNIGQLVKGIYLRDTDNGDFSIHGISSSFEGAEIIGRSSDLELPLENIKYILEVDGRNTDISFDEDKLEAGFFAERGDQLTIKGKMNGANDNSPKVIIKGYNIDVELD